MVQLIVIGPAGSGKSTLVKFLNQHLERDGYNDVKTCNLDAGAEDDFLWDIDVRKSFTIFNIMQEYELGPNGAIQKAYELLARNFDTILTGINPFYDQDIIIDSPGQLDPLIFSNTGNTLLRKLSSRLIDLIAVFLIPGDIINDPYNYAFLVMLLSGLIIKLHIPVVFCVSKCDLITSDIAFEYINDPEKLREALLSNIQGEMTEFSILSTDVMEKLLPSINLVKISINNETYKGIDDLLDLLKESKCACGDLS